MTLVEIRSKNDIEYVDGKWSHEATLELELGKLNDAHPVVTAATGGLLDAGAQPVRRHRRALAKEKSR